MDRHIVGSVLTDMELLGINNNFEFLFQGYDKVKQAQQEVISTADSYLTAMNNTIEQYQRDSVTPVFEKGGWNTGGAKVTGTDPVNLRSISPYYLRKGMTVSTKESDVYEYEFLIRKSDDPNDTDYVSRTGLIDFGKDYTVNHGNYYYLVIHRKDDAAMTDSDVTSVTELFNSITLVEWDVKQTIDIIDSMGLVSNEAKSVSYEVGSVDPNTGEKTFSTNRVKSTDIIRMNKGDVVNTTSNPTYEYSLMYYNDGIYESGWGLGYYAFGTDYTMESGKGVIPVIRRVDGANITQSDISNISRDFKMEGLSNVSPTFNEVMMLVRSPESSAFEVGSIDPNTGAKTASVNRTRSSTIIELKENDVVKSVANDKYEYSLMLYKDGVYESGWGLGYHPLDFEYRADEAIGIIPVIRRLDDANITESDIAEIERDFKYYTIKEDSNEAPVEKGIDKFNIIGELESYMTGDLTDYIANPNTITPQELHDKMIALVNVNSDISSYQLLGQDNYSNNLYMYKTNPYAMRKSDSWNTIPTGSTGVELNIPKIIITSGVHGREKNANYAVYYFMQALLNNPENNPVLDTLLTNIEFIFVPLINPSGFIDVTYENRAGVNLNRDFPPYGNTTQPESAIVKNIIDAYSDADYHIDFHNHTAHDTVIGYALTSDEGIARVATNAYKYIGRQWQLKNADFPQDRTYLWAYTADDNVGTVGRYSTEAHGIPSSIIETAVTHPFVTEGNNGKLITQLGLDLLVNTLVGLLIARR